MEEQFTGLFLERGSRLKTFDGESVSCDEFIEMLQVTKQKHMESPQGGTVDVESLCNDCVNMVLELKGQLEETEKYAATFINLLSDKKPDLCLEMKAVKGGCDWCNNYNCMSVFPSQDCVLKYAELKVGEMDADRK